MIRRLARRSGAVAALAVALCAGGSAPASASEQAPGVTAPEAILLEPQTGDVLFDRASSERRQIASTTKLMTVLLVLERDSLDDVFAATDYEPSSPAETRLGLREGERMTVRDLLRGLLLASANDAAQTLAVRTAGSTEAFVDLMNRRARELELTNTRYANPIGLDDPGNYSSAADLAKLAARLRTIPFFARTVALPRARLTSGAHPRVVENRNDLVGSTPFVNGVKTGHTLGAGYVLVGSATRGGVTVISVVLGEPSESARDADTGALLDYGLRQLRSVKVIRAREAMASAAVVHADGETVRLVAGRGVTRIVRAGERPVVTVRAPRRLEGPLPSGAEVGRAVVRIDGRVVDTVPVLTASRVRHVGMLERAVDRTLRPDTLAGLALVAAAAALAVVTRRRRQRHRMAGTA